MKHDRPNVNEAMLTIGICQKIQSVEASLASDTQEMKLQKHVVASARLAKEYPANQPSTM